MAGILFTRSAGISFFITIRFKRPEKIHQTKQNKTIYCSIKKETIRSAARLLAKHVCLYKELDLVVSFPVGYLSIEINRKLHTTAGT